MINLSDTLRKEIKEKLEKGQFNCEKEFTLSIISGKWKVVIIWHLGHEGPYRFNELQRLFSNISHKVLANQLKELTEDGIITRKTFDEVPPKVEYSISELGSTLIPIVDMLYEWGKMRIQQLKDENLI